MATFYAQKLFFCPFRYPLLIACIPFESGKFELKHSQLHGEGNIKIDYKLKKKTSLNFTNYLYIEEHLVE